MIPEEAEDMWHAYNLIAVGDSLRSTTIRWGTFILHTLPVCRFIWIFILHGNIGSWSPAPFSRKVQTETATGSTSSNKVRTMLTINVESTDFDTQACVLRVKGRNIQENQYVKVLELTLKLRESFHVFFLKFFLPLFFWQMGAYHTLDLELNRKFTLGKQLWDSVALERLGEFAASVLVVTLHNWMWCHRFRPSMWHCSACGLGSSGNAGRLSTCLPCHLQHDIGQGQNWCQHSPKTSWPMHPTW